MGCDPRQGLGSVLDVGRGHRYTALGMEQGVCAPDEPPAGRSRDWLRAGTVALLALVVFLPALRNGFVDLDDRHLLVDNPHFRGLGWRQLGWMFTTTFGGPYLPLTWLSFALDHAVWGLDPFGYHLTNVLLHAANAGVFYLLAHALLVAARLDAGRARTGALVAALCFAVHPLRVESVAWATGRKDVLSGLFTLLALLWYVRAATGAGRGWRRASVLAFALGLLAKGIGMSLPAVLVVLDVYPLRRLPADLRRWGAAALRPVLIEKLPYLALALAAVAIGVVGQAQAGAITSLVERSPTVRVATAVVGLAFYLWKTVLPIGLAPMHHLPLPFDPLGPRVVASAVAVAGITLAAVVLRRRLPALGAVWLCYVLALAPVLGVVQLGLQLVAERYTYLACLGWAVLAGALVVHGAGVLRRVLAAAVLVVLAALTWRQTAVWRGPETLWRHALAVDDTNYLAHHFLALTLAGDGRGDEALAHQEDALRLAPGYVAAHEKVAELYAARGDTARAAEHLETALAFDPDRAGAHYNLGVLRHGAGALDDAIAHYRAALAREPAHADAHDNLGAALYATGRASEAVAHFQEALRLDAARAGTHYNLGAAWLQLGRFEDAAGEFRAALQIDPARADARQGLATVTPLLGRSP